MAVELTNEIINDAIDIHLDGSKLNIKYAEYVKKLQEYLERVIMNMI